MTRPLIARRAFAAILAGLGVLVAGCGGNGGDSGGNAGWRVVNLSNDISPADVYVNTTKTQTAVAIGGVTTYQTITVGSYALKVTASPDTTSVLASTFTFSPAKDKNYSAIVTGRSGSARLATLLDDEDTSSTATGTARVRVYNASPEAGALDVYITNVADIATVTPNISGLSAASVSGFRDVQEGTYRLRVTGAGDPNDVRLDVPGYSVASKEASTLVITAGVSGALADAAKVVQGGAVTPLKNTQARVRVVAGVVTSAQVSVTVGGAELVTGGQRSPSLSSYARVESQAGANQTVALSVNGTPVTSFSRSFAAGGDYTVIVYGTTAAPQIQVLTDDNRLPATGRYRMRLVHVDSSLGGLTLQVDSQELDPVVDVLPGTTSGFATATSNSTALVEVNTSSDIRQIYSKTDVNLASQGVYSLFVIGGKTDVGNNPIPTVQLRKDR